MSSYNGVIVVDTERIDRELRRVGAVQNQVATYKIVGVPSYAETVKMTVFNEYNEGFPQEVAGKLRDGEWEVAVHGFCFPDVGDVRFELNAYTGSGADEVQRPLGWGKVRVSRYFGTTFEPAPHPETVVGNAIRDKDGGVHKIEAVDVGEGGEEDWTSRVGKRESNPVGLHVIETIPDGDKKKHGVEADNVGTEKDPDWSVKVKGAEK